MFLFFLVVEGVGAYLTLFKRIFKVENKQTNIYIKLSFSRAIYVGFGTNFKKK